MGSATQTHPQVLCFNLEGLPVGVQFATMSVAVFVIFVGYGYLQEALFSQGLKPFSWFITWVQFITYSAMSYTEMHIRGVKRVASYSFADAGVGDRVSLSSFVQVAVLTVGTMGFSNASLAYLTYPTQVVFKSCKLLPVMIGGMIIQGKTFTTWEFIASLVLSAGLAVFTLADVAVQPNFSTVGVALISAALCADAAIGNVQEKLMKNMGVHSTEMVFQSYSIGSVLVLAVACARGEVLPALAMIQRNGVGSTLVPMLTFSACGYLGVNVVLGLVQHFGALTAVTVTTTRKALTLVVSFVFFPKPFVMGYVWGGVLILAGIAINVAVKQQKKQKQPQAPVLPYSSRARVHNM